MIDTEKNIENKKKYNEKKQIEINEIITKFKFNKETLLIDQYNDCELFNKIKKIAKTRGGFLNNNNRKILWDYLFYKRKNKKGIIDLIKINKNIELSLSKLNLKSQIKELTEDKLNSINEYQIILNDLPRTCKNIIENDSLSLSKSNSSLINTNNNQINNISNSISANIYFPINRNLSLKSNNSTNEISPEIFLFSCGKLKYKYLQGLLNIVFYFKKIFNYENCINALNIYFEFFYKDFVDKELNEENNDENVALISSVVSDLYCFLYSSQKSDMIEDYIPILCNKWIISNFVSELKDIKKGLRLLDYLIVSEPHIRYILATVLMKKFNSITLDKMKIDIDSSFENVFEELKKEDLNSIDFDEVINEVENINNIKGKEIKKILNEKYGKQFIYSFNLNNEGLISYYRNLANLFGIKKPKKEFKINYSYIKYIKYFIIVLWISIAIYSIYHYSDKKRYFW